MKLTVRYFALLRERAGRDQEVLSWEGAAPTVWQFREHLAGQSPALAEVLLGRALLVAVNREYAVADTLLRDGDEIAFFPPVSGG